MQAVVFCVALLLVITAAFSTKRCAPHALTRHCSRKTRPHAMTDSLLGGGGQAVMLHKHGTSMVHTPADHRGPAAPDGYNTSAIVHTTQGLEIFSGLDTSDEAQTEDIVLFGFIARGASGAVYRAKWNGMKCTVKRFGVANDPVRCLSATQDPAGLC
jgi:hypothetical protein